MYKVSAPGSLMLMGEHAVLNSKSALVFAINKRITVNLTPLNSDEISINSSLGKFKLNKNHIEITKPCTFILQAIKFFQAKLPTGFNLDVDSEMSSTVGFGSSAAVSAATVASILWWLNGIEPEERQVFAISKEIIVRTQNAKGSAADLAASIYGGILVYNLSPFNIEKLSQNLNILAVYCGYKTPTVDVIKIVEEKAKLQPEYYQSLYDLMEICTKRAIVAIKDKNLIKLGQTMKEYQKLLTKLGVSDKKLDLIFETLIVNNNIYGAKISGSGLGDCVIGIGKNQVKLDQSIKFTENFNKFNLQVSAPGLEYVAA